MAPSEGTTRDLLEAEVEIAGMPVTLIDTAGLRAAGDPVEEEGVRRARAAAAGATVVVELWPADGDRAPQVTDGPGVVTVRLRSKADLLEHGSAAVGWLAVSCVTGLGLDELRSRLALAVGGDVAALGGEVAIGRRHRRVLERAADELARCDVREAEVAAEALRWAERALAELIGEVASEDVLDEVFASFCIGK